jgi:hypothetical protein
MSSSGFVPFPSSNRDENEYGPSNAPLPSFIVPLPSLRVPSHTADPVRVAMVLSPSFFPSYDSRRRPRGAIDFRPMERLHRRSPRQVPLKTYAASGAAAPGNDSVRSRFASASWRCLRPSQMLRTHQIAPSGTATQEMPTNPKPNHLINGYDHAPI